MLLVYRRSVAFDLSRIVPAAIFVLVLESIAMGLWYLSLRLERRRLKRWAVAVGLLPVLALGSRLANDYLAGSYDTFRTSTPGPPGRKGSTTRQIPFPVNEGRSVQQISVTPRASLEELPAGPVPLGYWLKSPQGETLAQGEEQLAPGQGTRWQPLKATVETQQPGTYMLLLEIFGPVDVADIEIRELHD